MTVRGTASRVESLSYQTRQQAISSLEDAFGRVKIALLTLDRTVPDGGCLLICNTRGNALLMVSIGSLSQEEADYIEEYLPMVATAAVLVSDPAQPGRSNHDYSDASSPGGSASGKSNVITFMSNNDGETDEAVALLVAIGIEELTKEEAYQIARPKNSVLIKVLTG